MKSIFRILRILLVILLMSVASFGVGVFGFHDRYRDKRINNEQVEKEDDTEV